MLRKGGMRSLKKWWANFFFLWDWGGSVTRSISTLRSIGSYFWAFRNYNTYTKFQKITDTSSMDSGQSTFTYHWNNLVFFVGFFLWIFDNDDRTANFKQRKINDSKFNELGREKGFDVSSDLSIWCNIRLECFLASVSI